MSGSTCPTRITIPEEKVLIPLSPSWKNKAALTESPILPIMRLVKKPLTILLGPQFKQSVQALTAIIHTAALLYGKTSRISAALKMPKCRMALKIYPLKAARLFLMLIISRCCCRCREFLFLRLMLTPKLTPKLKPRIW